MGEVCNVAVVSLYDCHIFLSSYLTVITVHSHGLWGIYRGLLYI